MSVIIFTHGVVIMTNMSGGIKAIFVKEQICTSVYVHSSEVFHKWLLKQLCWDF